MKLRYFGVFLLAFWLWFTGCAIGELGWHQARLQWPIAMVLNLVDGVGWFLIVFGANVVNQYPQLQQVASVAEVVQVLRQITRQGIGAIHSIFTFSRWTTGAFAVLIGLLLIGSSVHLRDLPLILVAGLITKGGLDRWQKKCPSLSRPWVGAMGTFLCSWVLLSSVDVLFTKPLSLTPKRFATLPHNQSLQEKRVAVALSGGGYRAALVHAGVLSMLDVLRIPISHVTTVSGGSIIGAFYAKGGSPVEFVDAFRQGRFHLFRELFNVLYLSRLVFPGRVPQTDVHLFPGQWRFDRTDVQAALLDRLLFQQQGFPSVDQAAAPRLMLCTTDLRTGEAVGITAKGVILHALPQSWERPEFGGLPLPTMKEGPVKFHAGQDTHGLAYLVAASGAFPIAFAPLPYQEFLLSDGGIFDNLGLTLLFDAYDLSTKHAELQDWRFDVVISSDAGAVFRERTTLELQDTIWQAADIMYANVGKALRGVHDSSPKAFFISPGIFVGSEGEVAEPTQYAIHYDTQKMLQDLPEDARQALRDALPAGQGRLTQINVAQMIFPKSPFQTPSTEANPPEEAIMADDMIAALQTFTRTPTLSDQMEEYQVGQLFRLGQYLVALQYADLHRALQ